MKFFGITITLLLILSQTVLAQEEPVQPTGEGAAKVETVAPQEEDLLDWERELELPAEEEAEPAVPTVKGEEPLDTAPPAAAPAGETKEGGPKKVTIDTVVYLDYQFFDSPNAFKVKYHINMGGNAYLATALIKGQAEIATEVTGHLAKWPEGECILDVSISKVPYEISYKQSGEDEADLNIKFKKEINEKWESTCTFIGGVVRPFRTEGPTEQWIAEALERAIPPLTSIVAPLEAGETTSLTFDIPTYKVQEENLGSAEIKGTGIVTIQPALAPKEGEPASRLWPLPLQKKGHTLAKRRGFL